MKIFKEQVIQFLLIFLSIKYICPIQIPTITKTYNHSSQTQSPLRNLLHKSLDIMPMEQMITILVCMGTPSLCLDVVFDTGSYLLWMTGKTGLDRAFFDSERSSSFIDTQEEISILFGSGEIKGSIVHDNLYFNSTFKLDNNFYWVLGKEVNVDPRFNGIMGFSKVYDNTIILNEEQLKKLKNVNFSFMNSLFKKKIISKKIFAYKQLYKDRGVLYLGETGLKSKTYPKCYPEKLQIKSYEKDKMSLFEMYNLFFGLVK